MHFRGRDSVLVSERFSSMTPIYINKVPNASVRRWSDNILPRAIMFATCNYVPNVQLCGLIIPLSYNTKQLCSEVTKTIPLIRLGQDIFRSLLSVILNRFSMLLHRYIDNGFLDLHVWESRVVSSVNV